MRRALFLLVVGLSLTVLGAPAGLERPAPTGGWVPPGGARDADPVDLLTGLYLRRSVDFVVPDIVPIVFSRHYLSSDTGMSRAFGIGTTHSYDTFLVGGSSREAALITEEGGRILYRRTSRGSSLETVVLEHAETPTPFFGSQMTWSDGQWRITLRSGAMYSFLTCTPTMKWPQCALIGYRDRFGNTTTLTRNADRVLVKIASPNGRWLRLAHDASRRVVRGWDSTGKSVDYEYDAGGRLAAAKASTGQVQTYEYDAGHRLTKIVERDGTEIVNDYHGDGRVARQVVTYRPENPGEPAPPADIFEFSYTVGDGRVTGTEIVRPGRVRRRVLFQASGYAHEDARTLLDGSGVTMTYVRDPASTVVSHVRVACREADGRETVLQAAVGAGVKVEAVAQALCRQCRVPFILDTEPEPR
ncbi:MAG: RHS repeat domain-containing protein [Candidatus Rokuibacteriota bacterium]